MSKIKIVIEISQEVHEHAKNYSEDSTDEYNAMRAIANGTPLTSDVLADLLMEERIRGELKQDISYSKDIIDDIKCRLTVDIIDHRPCYCGAELSEVWREVEQELENEV